MNEKLSSHFIIEFSFIRIDTFYNLLYKLTITILFIRWGNNPTSLKQQIIYHIEINHLNKVLVNNKMMNQSQKVKIDYQI